MTVQRLLCGQRALARCPRAMKMVSHVPTIRFRILCESGVNICVCLRSILLLSPLQKYPAPISIQQISNLQ